jgi:hypothetical protein
MSEVLYPPDCIDIHFKTLDVVDDAVKLFAADPVIGVVLLPKAYFLWEETGYALRLPNRAIERVINLLERFKVPFFVEAS